MVLNLDGLEVEEIRRPKHDYETAVVFGNLDGTPVVLKTFAFHPLLYRWLLGWLCRREARLLMALEPVAMDSGGECWLPAGARPWGRWGVLMPRVDGRPLRGLGPGDLPPKFISRLAAAVESLHGARVVHLDLKNAGNILVREGGHPVLLDFAGCLSFRNWPLVGGFLTRLFGIVDRAAVVKWKQDFFPGTLTAAETRLLGRIVRLRRWWPFPVRKLYRRGRTRVSPPDPGDSRDPSGNSPGGRDTDRNP